jgi:DNA-binding MarR family transcriptional regulator
VTGEQFDILLHLWDTDGQHQQKLAEVLYRDKTTMTRAINSLEALNLVKRISNKNDKRQRLVYLSKPGKKIAKELTSLAQVILLKTQKGIDPAELTISKNVLRKFIETLSKELT